MASPKQIIIKESITDLRKLLKSSTPLIATRIRALIELKKHEHTGIAKREVAERIGVNHNSVQTWRSKYVQGGIEALIRHEKGDGRPSSITKEEHKKIEKKLQDPKNGLRGYVELLTWVEAEFNKTIKYNTLLKYSIRNFGSKIKVARKGHVKKDEEAVGTFKKTLVKSAGKLSKNSKRNTKK